MHYVALLKYAAEQEVKERKEDDPDWEEYRRSRSPIARKLAEKRERDVRRNLMLGGLATAGAGAGILGLRNLAMDPREAGAVQDFINSDRQFGRLGENYTQSGKSFRDAMQAMKRYSIGGADAMSASLFGMAPDVILKAVRSTPFTPESARWNAGSQEHYDGFKRGPLHGWLRYMDEKVGENPHKYDKGLIDFHRKHLNEEVRKMTGIEKYFDTKTPLGYNEASDPKLSRDQQAAILAALPDSLTRKFGDKPGLTSFIPGTGSYKFHRKFRPMLELDAAYGPESSTKKYREQILGVPLALHKALGPLGWAALLGGTGLVGAGAYKYLKSRKKKKGKDDERKERGTD